MAIELLSALCPLCTLVAGPGAPLAQHSPVWSAPSLHSVASSSVPASLASFATLRDFPADVLATPVHYSESATEAIDHNGQPPRSTTLGRFIASLEQMGSSKYLFDRASFLEHAPRAYAAALRTAVKRTLPQLPPLGQLTPLPHGWKLEDPEHASTYVLVGANGTSTSFHAHGATAHLLLRGRKLWFLAPPGSRVVHRDPRGLGTYSPSRNNARKMTLLLQRAHEIVALPAGWHHAVLNLGTTVAFAMQRLMDPAPTPRLLNAAYQLEAAGKTEDAIALLETADAATRTKEIDAALGRLHLGRGEHAAAVHHLVAAQPRGRSDACAARGRLALERGDAPDLALARRACDAAVRDDPLDATARARRAEVLRALAAATAAGRVQAEQTPRELLEAAVEALEHATALAPARAALESQLAEALAQMGSLLPTLAALEARGGGAVGKSDPRAIYSTARAAHWRAIKIAPKRAVLRGALAMFLLDDAVLLALGRGALEEGIAAMRAAARLDPQRFGATVDALLSQSAGEL